MIYLDTSWLVKLYVNEPDSPAVRKSVASDQDLVVSDIAWVEFHSAVARRRRERSITARSATALIARFRQEWAKTARVTVSRDVLLRAAELVAGHALRSLEAIHLASALLLADGAPEPPRFGAADARLVAAAEAEGLATLTAGRG